MDRSLRKFYYSFPYIVFMGKYLIPQPPRSPRYYQQKLITSPLDMIRKYYPHAVDEGLLRLSPEYDKVELQNVFLKEHNKSVDEFKIKLGKYMETYVDPLKTIGKGQFPQILYYREHKEEIAAIMAKQGETRFFKTLYQVYKQLGQSQKKKYEEKCQAAIKESLQKYRIASAKHKIPQRTFVHPYILYLRETVDGPINTKMYGRYGLLSEEQKQVYRQKSRQLKVRDKQNLEVFLNGKQLTVLQFEFIKEICMKVDAIKKKRKKDRKTKKSQSKLNKQIQSVNKYQLSLPYEKDLLGEAFEKQEQFQNWKKSMASNRSMLIDEEYSSDDVMTPEETFKQVEQQVEKKKNDKQQ